MSNYCICRLKFTHESEQKSLDKGVRMGYNEAKILKILIKNGELYERTAH